MDKLIISQSAREQFKTLGVDCINNARGAVYFHGSMRGVTAAISKILCLNPGVEVQTMSTATIKVIEDKETAIVNACVVFKLKDKPEDE